MCALDRHPHDGRYFPPVPPVHFLLKCVAAVFVQQCPLRSSVLILPLFFLMFRSIVYASLTLISIHDSIEPMEQEELDKAFLLKVVQPGLAGLMDGLVSTLAPIL